MVNNKRPNELCKTNDKVKKINYLHAFAEHSSRKKAHIAKMPSQPWVSMSLPEQPPAKVLRSFSYSSSLAKLLSPPRVLTVYVVWVSFPKQPVYAKRLLAAKHLPLPPHTDSHQLPTHSQTPPWTPIPHIFTNEPH